MTREEIEKAKEDGKETGAKRKIRRICFHVLAVTLSVMHTDQQNSFCTPATDAELDQYFGYFAWNNWFFNEFLTRPEIQVEHLAYLKKKRVAWKAA